jgi:hypothetical protein
MGCLAYEHLWQIEHVKEEEILYDFAVRLFYSDKIQVPSHSGVLSLVGTTGTGPLYDIIRLRKRCWSVS